MTEPARVKRASARVLIVDPDESVARICSRALTHERLDVRTVNSSFAVWKELEEWRPQFYLIGDDFFDCLGVDLVAEVRRRTNAPIILVTTTDSIGYVTNGFEAGADDVIIRPVVPPLLLARCQAHLRRAYRYSVPPTANRPRPLVNGPSSAPVPPEAAPPAISPSYKAWPRCEGCGYIGPRERFEGSTASDNPIATCPACLNNRVSFSA